MSTASPPPPTASAPETSGSAQAFLGIFLAVLLGLLAFRGYGAQFGARPTEPAVTDLTDLNTAGESELSQVPGIGPKMAQTIVLHRQTNGPFKSVEGLKGVRGIGALTFDKVRHRFRVSTASPTPSEAPEPSVQITTTSFSSPIGQAPAPAIPPPKPAAVSTKKIQPGEPPINVNTASQDELQRLPSVGPVMAHAIVAARATRPFESVNDLDKVKGIGQKTLDKLRPFVTVR